jgi:hypothetical protein
VSWSGHDQFVTLNFEVRSEYAPRKYSTYHRSYREKPRGVKKISRIVNKISRFATGILTVRIVPYCTPRGNTVRTADRILCRVCLTCMYWIVGLSLAVRTVSHVIVSYRTVRVCRMYCIESLAVRIVSYRIVPYCTPRGNKSTKPRIVCTVRGLPYMYVLYCRPIARGLRATSYRVVLYHTVRRVVPHQYSILAVRVRIVS